MTAVYRTPGLPLVTPRPRPTFRPQLRALGLACLVALSGFGVRALEHAGHASDRRLSPELVAFADVLPIVLVATWLYAGWLVVRHGYWTVRHRSGLVRSLYVGGSILVHGVAATVLAGLLVVASPDWLFGPRAVTSVASPDGRSVAYLYGPALLGGCAIYVRASDEIYVHRTADSLACTAVDAGEARLLWPSGAASPTAVDAKGTPLPPEPPFPLFWGGGC